MTKRHIIASAFLVIMTVAIASCGNNGKNDENTADEKVAEQVNESRMLIIVDPQIDFISGSLAVEGGQEAIDNLIKAIDNGLLKDYDYIAITQDNHPKNHCSFKEQGGVFPPHCVTQTEGQIVYPQLKEQLSTLDNITISGFFKGESEDKEEFSIFQSDNGGRGLKQAISDKNFVGIDICGIASDYCVYETLKDLLDFYPADKVRVAMNCVAAVSDNEKLPAFMKEQGVEAIRF